ncbi:MAG: hypothetical protein HY783_09045 [Chloroflexi bacterium]|nr:hypothetical protein [Chloroflexota bacterium]
MVMVPRGHSWRKDMAGGELQPLAGQVAPGHVVNSLLVKNLGGALGAID